MYLRSGDSPVPYHSNTYQSHDVHYQRYNLITNSIFTGLCIEICIDAIILKYSVSYIVLSDVKSLRLSQRLLVLQKILNFSLFLIYHYYASRQNLVRTYLLLQF